jgi:cytochrome c553
MGRAAAEDEPAPDAAQVAAAGQRIAAGGATTARGRELFAAQGCDRCHAIAATGADGRLGPRLDRLDDDADDIAEAIADPRDEIADGFAEELMPTDYARRLGDADLQALAAFVAAASGEEAGDGSGRGRRGGGPGRGSGRGGDGD